MFLVLRAAQLRYMLPGAFLLGLFAVYAVLEAWRYRRSAGMVAAMVLAAALGVQVLRAADLTWLMIRDSRYAAAAWLAQHTRRGDRIEFFGAQQKLPPLSGDVVSRLAAPFHGMYVESDVSDSVVARILAGWTERRPRYVLAIPDYTSEPGVPYSRSFPPQLYQAMLDGRVAWRLAAYFETTRLFPWLPLPALDYPTVNPPIRIFEPDPGEPGSLPPGAAPGPRLR
jgi:hypothetical protein